MSAAPEHVVVIGGGVIGAACAYYLVREGVAVTIIDQGQFGRGCSHANCGFVCPSHVLPLAAPGAVRMGIKALLTPNSPLAIRWRCDWRLWSWFWQFARRCNRADMLAAGRGIAALLNSSRRLFDDLIRDEALDVEWEQRGLLFVYRTQEAFEHYADTDRLLREHFGVAATPYDGRQLESLEPALKPGLGGAWHYPGDAHLRPDKLMSAWREVLVRRGVAIREMCGLTALHGDSRRATAIDTNQGRITADAFVVATGAWTPRLEKQLGCRVPIQPGKGYSLTMPRPARCPTMPLIFEEHRVAVTPMQSGFRLGSTMEFAGYDAALRPRRLDLLRRAAELYLVEPYTQPISESWFGWRPMTPDGLPILDRAPRYSNVVLATGHNMLGLSMAPATGRVVMELLLDRPASAPLESYSLARWRSRSVVSV